MNEVSSVSVLYHDEFADELKVSLCLVCDLFSL